MGEIRYKLRSLEARQNWHFKCLLFKNYWTDLLEIFTESAKVYSHCVYEISKQSEKLLKILAPLILGLQWWNKAELKLVCGAITGYFLYFKIFELTMEIRCHSDKNFQYLHQRHQWSLPPPLSYFVLVASYLSVFGSFPTYILVNFDMSALSERSFISLLQMKSLFGKFYVYGYNRDNVGCCCFSKFQLENMSIIIYLSNKPHDMLQFKSHTS